MFYGLPQASEVTVWQFSLNQSQGRELPFLQGPE